MKANLWWVSRRHRWGGEMRLQIKTVRTFDEAINIARKWFRIHGTGYGIKIAYKIEEIGELVEVRFFDFIGSEDDIK